jgi:Mg2+/Co2+ transporter CorB
LVNIAASSLASISYFGVILGPSLITVIMFLIIVTFAEIIPKVIGRVYSHGLAKLYAYPILIFKYLFIPFVYATSALGRLIVSPLYKKAEDEEEAVSDENSRRWSTRLKKKVSSMKSRVNCFAPPSPSWIHRPMRS